MKNFLFAFFICSATFAQDGYLDISWGTDGMLYFDSSTAQNPEMDDWGADIGLLPNDRFIVLFNKNLLDLPQGALMVANADGTLDTDFGTDGVVDLPMSQAFRLHVQSDGRSVIRGQNEQGDLLVRYDNDVQDLNFGDSGLLQIDYEGLSSIRSLLLQDDSIIVWGKAPSDSNGGQLAVVALKYDSDGMLDMDFGTDGVVEVLLPTSSFRVHNAKETTQGDIVLYSSSDGLTPLAAYLVKLSTDGTLANEFGQDGITSNTVNSQFIIDYIVGSMDILPNGQIVLVGIQPVFCELPGQYTFLMKFEADGQAADFGTNGVRILPLNAHNLLSRIIALPNNRFLLTGYWTDCFEWGWAAASRYYSSGHIETSFNIPQWETFEMDHNHSVIASDGSLMILGTTPWYNGDTDLVLARFNNNHLGTGQYTTLQLTISPNPSNGIFQIQSPETALYGMDYQVSDISGKIIIQGTLKDQIDLSFAESGIYFLKLAGQTVKLLKK